MVLLFISPLLVTQAAILSAIPQAQKKFNRYVYGALIGLLLVGFYYVYYVVIFTNIRDIYGFGGIPPYEKSLSFFKENDLIYFFWSTLGCEALLVILLILKYANARVKRLFDYMKPIYFGILATIILLYLVSPLPSDIAGFSLRTIEYGDFLRVENNRNFISYVATKYHNKNIKVSSLLVYFIIRENGGYFCKIYGEEFAGNNLYKNIFIGYYFIPLRLMHDWNVFI